MPEITRALMARVGVELAKNVIQVHALDAAGRREVSRALEPEQFLAWCALLPQGCLVAMQACGGAHHWARQLKAMGLDARLIAANFVTPYRMEGKSGKNDMADAAAICAAASRPAMRLVPVHTPAQQGLMSLHRLRAGFKEERTACSNRMRGALVEAGLVFGKSPKVQRAAPWRSPPGWASSSGSTAGTSAVCSLSLSIIAIHCLHRAGTMNTQMQRKTQYGS